MEDTLPIDRGKAFGRLTSAAGVRIALTAVGALFLTSAGCRTPGESDAVPSGSIHELVGEKIAIHRAPAEGAAAWERMRSDEYQRPEDLVADRLQLEYERSRERVAAEVRENPLDLITSLAFALEFNDRIQAERAAMRAVGGERIVTQSRFLPTAVYSLRHESVNRKGSTSTNDTQHLLRLSQTVLEFGRDNPSDVTLRESERSALFAYEDAVRDVLSAVRKTFFTVVLRRQQLEERQKLLEEFRERHRQMSELEATRRVLEVDVLTARLNMLNEEARINGLEREIMRKHSDLLYLTGLPPGETSIHLQGAVSEFGLSLDEATQIALLRSSGVAQARAEVAEQARRVREIAWDFTPDLAMRAGWKDDRTLAGLGMETADGFYELSTFAEAHDEPFGSTLETELDLLNENEDGWYVDLALDLPIFEGLERRGRYRKEKALLEQAQHRLRDRIDSVGLAVRKQTQTVLERRKDVDILGETVDISRKRLRVQERLKELGKISDNELETFRNRFFQDQDAFFTQQIGLVGAQEDLRAIMRFFEPLTAE